MPYDEWNLTVGEIVAPFGLKGEVKVRLETDFPNRFLSLKQVCLRWPTGEARLYAVESARLHKNQALLKLRGIARIEDTEALKNTMVLVRSADAVPLPGNEFYIHTLIGCEVVTVEGRVLGTLTSVMRGPANDVFAINEGKEEILLPAIKEVIREVDVPNRRVTVAPTPGLLPDDEAEVA